MPRNSPYSFLVSLENNDLCDHGQVDDLDLRFTGPRETRPEVEWNMQW